MHLFHLDWFVDRDGYRIISRRGEDFIVGNGGELDHTEPFKIPGLCRRLAACEKTPDGALGFVSTYGPLFGPVSDRVANVINAIGIAQDLYTMAHLKQWNSIAGLLEESMLADKLSRTGGVGRLSVVFAVGSEKQRPQLNLVPSTLFDAALVQLLEEISSERPLRKCKRPGCPEWFTYGPGTKHRETAFYCSSKCQKAHEYQRRKES